MPTTSSFLRFLRDVPGFVRDHTTLEAAQAIVRDRLSRREESFLSLMKTSVFERPQSPYRWLFDVARCEHGDLERSVRADGVEKALGQIRAAGVYVTFEEFKGRRPIERDGRTLIATPADFDMPGDRGSFKSTSGGSTGAGTPFSVSIATLRGDLPVRLCYDAMFGVNQGPVAHWWEILPSPTGVVSLLRRLNAGFDVQRWFYPPIDRGGLGNARARIATGMIVAAARFGGVTPPKLEAVHLADVEKIVRWAEESLACHGRCAIASPVSRVVRIAAAAKAMGVDLAGCVFDTGSESMTAGKAREIRSSGADFYAGYYLGEAGVVGGACGNPDGPNDVHFCLDRFALITAPRQVQDDSYDEMFITCLHDSPPKLLLNLGTDDFATVDERPCGCALAELGLTLHVRDIYSFSKLTGEGVTLLGSDMVRILEEVLPARFGGSPLDYQLHEVEEDARVHLDLVVDPTVNLPDDAQVVSVMLDALGSDGLATDIRQLWSQAGTVRVKRRKPIVTARGKQMPIVSAKRSEKEGNR